MQRAQTKATKLRMMATVLRIPGTAFRYPGSHRRFVCVGAGAGAQEQDLEKDHGHTCTCVSVIAVFVSYSILTFTVKALGRFQEVDDSHLCKSNNSPHFCSLQKLKLVPCQARMQQEKLEVVAVMGRFLLPPDTCAGSDQSRQSTSCCAS